jgi:hypothetical protein
MTKRKPCCRACVIVVRVSALVGAAGCGEPAGHTYPEGGGTPYGVIPVPSEESALHASTSCALSLTSLPAVSPTVDPAAGCFCTRRAGPQGGEAGCIGGADWGVTATVGPEGGDVLLRGTPFLESSGLGVLLRIPPNALSETTTIRIIETSVTPPAGYADGSPIYAFEPSGLTFATPAEIRIPWSFSQSGSSPPVLYGSSGADPCALEPLADNHTGAGVNRGTVTRLGWAAVGLPLPTTASACP